ncbi:DUF6504 family protein [Actinocorallia longicatena]|uniref:DUF6504 domain-containing protein n=1 Tax=Actinocorallia longicatena TaxID=111803 RepID=A0ABP6QQ69_9ACTN
MNRVYGDPVEVWPGPDGQPARFVWRDRLFVVRRVMRHWVSTRDWRGDELSDGVEREFWQVEASPGREIGVYELRLAPESGTWQLSRSWS